MATLAALRLGARAPGALAALRPLSTIPVNRVASVLKLNVGDEATAIKLDEKMKAMTEMMREYDGFESATRYVCKSEWAYELSFIFRDIDSFKAWGESSVRNDKVHPFYEEAMKECGLDEDKVYGGARVVDNW